MEPRSINFLAQACEGVLIRGVADAQFCGVSTDTRELGAGQAFVAISGPRFDGHDYLVEAGKRGAAVVVADRRRPLPGGLACPVVQVESTRLALGRLATVWRAQWDLPVIGVAGSNGKTTTKDLIASVLGRRLRTLRSPASYNNDVGVPLTLLQLGAHHEAAVVEAGTNHPGELAPLLRMIQPQIGVLTSLGREHLEHFGSMEGVVEEEGALAEILPAGGCLLVHGDSPWVDRVARRCAASVIRVGLGPGNDWRAEIERVSHHGVAFALSGAGPRWDGDFQLPLLGQHQVTNALLALAVGARLGLERHELALGLAECPRPSRRMESRLVDGIWVLDDVYNANPDSVLAALETLSAVPCTGRRIAVIGNMEEVGDQAERLHGEVGDRAASLGLDQLWAVGSMAAATARAARGAGLGAVEVFEDPVEAAGALVRAARAGDVILVKASRAARLERISDALCNRAKAA